MFRPLFAETWRGLGDDHTVVRRDLHREPLPHLTDAARLRVDGEASDAAAEKLQAELAYERRREDPQAAKDNKKLWASRHKAARAWMKQKRRGPDD